MNYKDLIIKEYENWTLYLNENQSYLGRCYLWYVKDKPLDIFDLEGKPLNELYNITKTIKRSLNNFFQPDNFNYASLNNLTRHLHFHIIPRYEQPRTFDNHVFEDKNWGNNYSPYPKDYPLSPNTIKKILTTLQSDLKER